MGRRKEKDRVLDSLNNSLSRVVLVKHKYIVYTSFPNLFGERRDYHIVAWCRHYENKIHEIIEERQYDLNNFPEDRPCLTHIKACRTYYNASRIIEKTGRHHIDRLDKPAPDSKYRNTQIMTGLFTLSNYFPIPIFKRSYHCDGGCW